MSEIEVAPKFAPFFGMVRASSTMIPGKGSCADNFPLRVALRLRYTFTCSRPIPPALLMFPDDIRLSVQRKSTVFLDVADNSWWIGAGAAYGTAKAGIGIANVGTFRPDLIMKVRDAKLVIPRRFVILIQQMQSLIPVVMAGIIAVYSLVIGVLIAGAIEPDKNYSLFKCVISHRFENEHGADIFCSGFLHLAAGLSVGLTGLAAGYAIGIVGDAVR